MGGWKRQASASREENYVGGEGRSGEGSGDKGFVGDDVGDVVRIGGGTSIAGGGTHRRSTWRRGTVGECQSGSKGG